MIERLASDRRYPRELAIEPCDAGQPIERFLRRRLHADPAHVEKLLRQRRVTLRCERDPEAAPRVLASGVVLPDSGTVAVSAVEARPPQPNRRLFVRVLRQTPDWLVVDKPPGVATHPGPRLGADTVLNALVARFPELLALGKERGYGIVHRLDLGTSGVLLVARMPAASDALNEAFATRRVEKRYLALVDERRARLADCDVREPVGGKDAHTRIEVLERAGPVAQGALHPLTGRTHQLRIHLTFLGAPVLGDDRHGAGPDDLTAKLYLKRLALHAERIAFPDPRTGERVEVVRPWPRDLNHAWQRARRLFGAARRG